MNKNLTNEEFVNSYLDNELSEIDQLDFENKLLHDSELREEYSFQKDLVNGIKESRRLELKSRLSNIPINTPLYQTLGFKAIAVATISAGVGIGAYYFFNEDDALQLSEIDLNENQITEVDERKVPEAPKSITPILEVAPQEEVVQEIVIQEKPKSEAVAKNTEKTEPMVIQPNVIEPDVAEPFDDDAGDIEEIATENQVNNLDNIKENVESTVEIATVKDKRNKFHYKFFENKLYLLGSFNDMPYEIIELNAATGKSYFLYYDDSFFKLNAEQAKPAPLVKIENDSLVYELKIIQSNHQ